MKYAILLGVLMCTASCSRPDFPKYSLVSGLRILTIKASADQGEVNPGTTVTLEPVVSDIGGGGRTLNVTVTTCMDPGVSYGAAPVCKFPDSTTTSTLVPPSTGGTYIGAAPTVSVSVPSTLPLFMFAPPYMRYNGMAYLVIYTLTAPDGNSTTAFKRLVISDPTKTIKNKNPAIATVSANGVALSPTQAYSTSGMDLNITFSQGGETYSYMKPDGSLVSYNESLFTTWYFTDGEMKYQRTSEDDSNHWDASKQTGRSTVLVVVTHDGRGGEDYKIFEFN